MPALLERESRRCLGDRDFEDLDSGNLSDQELDGVYEHISSCARCETLLHKWKSSSGDQLSDRVRKCFLLEPLGRDAVIRRLEAEVLDQTGSLPEGERQAVASGFASVSASLIGNTIGRNQILDEIGRGGMGIVFRAWQESVKRYVAVKIIRAGFYADSSAIVRFRTEAGAIARLQHPHVAQLYEFSEHGGLPYFVMELVEGGSLEKTLAKGQMPCRRAAELTKLLAGAVEYAHQKQVIHRDLKPSNILLTNEGTPKIADFGLAKMLDEQGSETQSDAILGTPSYMAPEQAAGHKSAVGRLTDVYALGAILYEATTGQPPYKGEDRLDTLRRVSSGELTRPSRLRPDLPKDLEAICMKCLAWSPSRRYQSAQALADDLELWLGEQRPQQIPGFAGRAITRLRRNWIVAAFSFVCLLFVAAIYLGDPDRPLREMQSQLAQGKPVTLIAEKGKPTWFRWLEGEESGKMVVGPDGAVVIHSTVRTLFELLPSVDCDRYRYQVRIRHEKSNMPGEVGIYFAHNSVQVGDVPVHFFMQLSFNDVRGKNDMPIIIARGQPVPQVPNFARLISHFYSRERVPPKVDSEMAAKYGPAFDPVGERQEGWRELAVTVTPDLVTAEWDGRVIRTTTEEITKAIDDELAYLRKRLPQNTALTVPRPKYTPRGGLGLFVDCSSAAFCSASVIPQPKP